MLTATGGTSKRGKRLPDLIGKRFGRLVVLSYAGHVTFPCGNKQPSWDCVCDCGRVEPAVTKSRFKGVEKGVSPACDFCRRQDKSQRATVHGLTKTPEFHTWRHMKDRCLCDSSKDFSKYGARGITVCERWLTFENFYTDMGLRPSRLHGIERLNKEEGYTPSNCVWATKTAQNRNKRNNVLLTAFGETKTIAEWAEQKSIAFSTIHTRITRLKWSHEDAVSTTARRQRGTKDGI